MVGRPQNILVSHTPRRVGRTEILERFISGGGRSGWGEGGVHCERRTAHDARRTTHGAQHARHLDGARTVTAPLRPLRHLGGVRRDERLEVAVAE